MRSFFSLSLALHAVFVLACLVLSSQRPAQLSAPKPLWVEIESPAKNRVVQKAALEERIKNQIVQTSKGMKAKQAEKDAFLGEVTQRVDRQSVSRQHETVMGANQQGSTERNTTKPRLAQLGLPLLPAPTIHEALNAEAKWNPAGSVPQDYVRGLAEGDRTALNTKEFVYYGYFQRIRQRLDQAWVPILRQKLVRFYKAGRQLASDVEHTTRVLVTLNPSGEITKVSVLTESGSRDLDEAAIGAFNRAGPFPNPPKGIVDRNGEIQIPWEFILRT